MTACLMYAEPMYEHPGPTPLDLMFEGKLDTSASSSSSSKSHPPLCGVVGQTPAPDVVPVINPASLHANEMPPASSNARRVPCKARGVSGKHNPHTAYFDIPLNARHGMLLVCSHPDCADSGRRFRYCAVCDLPVAKRNFMKRHAHGLVASPRTTGFAELNGEVPLLDEDLTKNGTKRRRTLSYDAAEGLLATTTSQLANSVHAPAPTAAGQLFVNSTAAVPAPTGAVGGHPAPAPVTDSTTVAMQLNPREVQWLALLHNRPTSDDTTSMERWIDRVIQVSEHTASPAPVVSAMPPTAPPSSTESTSQTSALRTTAHGDSSTSHHPHQARHAHIHHDFQSHHKEHHDAHRVRRRSSTWSAISLENLSLGRMDSLFDDDHHEE